MSEKEFDSAMNNSKEKEQRYKKIISGLIEAYNHFDVKKMLRDVHPMVQFQNISDGEITVEANGIDELRVQAEKARHYFTQREQKITDIRFEDDWVEVEIDYTAVLAVEFPNGLKPGDELKLKGKSIFRFEDEKIIEIKDIS